MKLKRITLLLLSLVMILSSVVAVPLSVSAEAATVAEMPTGANESTAGYQPSKVVKLNPAVGDTITMQAYHSGGRTSSAKYISISSPAEFKLFADLVNGMSTTVNSATGLYSLNVQHPFDGKVIYLTQDIDMINTTIMPIGFRAENEGAYVYGVNFFGSFDGQGYTIDNLKMAPEPGRVPKHSTNGGATALWVGLFAKTCSANNVIRNVVLGKGCVFTNKTNSDYGSIGSILGAYVHAGAVLENCYSEATVVNEKKAGGGIIGRGDAHVTASNLTFAGSTTTASFAAGILGYHGAGCTLTSCVNEGTVTTTGLIAGGIIARFDGPASTLTNCINKGEVKSTCVATEPIHLGGLVGRATPNMTPSVDTNDVNGNKNTTEKLYFSTNTLTLTNCTNTFAGFDVKNIRGDVYVDNFYNLQVDPVWKDNAHHYIFQSYGKNLTVNATNCKGVQINAGFDASRITSRSGSELGTQITAATTAATISGASTFYVDSPEGLMRVASLVNTDHVSFWGKTVYIAKDLDMKGYDWMPIGLRPSGNAAGHYAAGMTLDGLGHTISNLVCAPTWEQSSSVGLLGMCYNNTTIRNLIFDSTCAFIGSQKTDRMSVGSFLGYNGGDNYGGTKVINCKSSALVVGGNAGGLIGGGPAVLRAGTYFCTFDGTVRGVATAGGIYGGLDDAANSMNCVNYGTVFASTGRAAGISTDARGSHQIRNNVNYGSVTMFAEGNEPNTGASAAGVFALSNNNANRNNMEVRGNYNYGATASSVNTQTVWAGDVVSFGKGLAEEYENKTLNPVVWGNYNMTPYIGYNTDLINKVDTDKLVDIKDAYEITDEGTARRVTLKTGVKMPYMMKITDKEGMRLLSALVYLNGDNMSGKAIYLANDIGMSGLDYNVTDSTFTNADTFLPIGYDGKSFNGIFDGQGYTVKSWTIGNSRGNRIGLFGLTSGAIIQNLVFADSNKVTGTSFDETCRTGVIVEANSSAINNIWNQKSWAKDVTSDNCGIMGGIAALTSKTGFTNCTNDGDVIGVGGAGGIIGSASHCSGISNCRNNGTVSATYTGTSMDSLRAGGIIGSHGNSTNSFIPRMINVVNNGKIVVPDETGVWAGAFLGYSVNMPTTQVWNGFDYAGNATLYGKGQSPNATPFRAGSGTTGDLMKGEMLTTRYQARTAVGATQDIRLIGTVDVAENYKEAGFILTYEGETFTAPTTKAYTSLIAAGDECTPENYGACTSQYFFAETFNGVDGAFTAQCYVVTMDGETILGNTVTVNAPNVPYSAN